MTPMQDAAKAAKDKLALPVCKCCGGSGEVREWICGETERDTCPECGGCGVDTSDPDTLIGRSVRWLSVAGRSPEIHRRLVSCARPYDLTGHNDTPDGIAAALLRLVARCAP